jgi:hypothetical protein
VTHKTLGFETGSGQFPIESASVSRWPEGRAGRRELVAPDSFCQRKLTLLRAFSTQTDQLSAATVRYARLAGNTADVKGLDESRRIYQNEKAETKEAYLRFLDHCREHGC